MCTFIHRKFSLFCFVRHGAGFRGMSIAPPRKLYPFAMILKPRLSQRIYPCQFPYLEWAGLEADVGGA